MAAADPQASAGAPSPWVMRFAALIAPGGRVLDVAAGRGRHARWLASRGFAVTAVDRDAEALAAIGAPVHTQVADLEGDAWPFAAASFDAVVVANYLWRPHLPALLATLAPGGVWIHETFGIDQASVGRPSNPEFLLGHGELLRLAEGLRIVAYEDGFLDAPGRFVQRIAAVRERPGAAPARHPLGLGDGLGPALADR